MQQVHMDPSDDTRQQLREPPQAHTSSRPRTLQVDFSWKKFETLVSEKEDGAKAKPLYILDYKLFKRKNNLVFRDAVNTSTIIGTGTLHAVAIHCACEIRGREIALRALKRWSTSYTHLSHHFSAGDGPVPMTWAASCGLARWDFVCLDPHQTPVARFSANIWAPGKVGAWEFLGPRTAASAAAREELVLVGLVLYTCMVYRSSNVLSVFGALWATIGKVQPTERSGRERAAERVAGEEVT